ncbi:MAG: HAD-IA family hydrolase [Candidatus Brocadiia bacterium]
MSPANPSRYRLMIFDFDGTLVDSAPGICATARIMTRQFGLRPFTRRRIISSIGAGLDHFLAQLFPARTKKSGMAALITTYRQIYDRKYKTGLKIFPGVKPTLKNLSQRKIIMTIVSNKLKRYVDGINKELGIHEYFDTVLGSDDVKKRKPHPWAVYHLMKKYRVRKEQVLFIGDSEYDVITAQNAGVDCAFLEYGYADRVRMEKLRPRYRLKRLSELRPLA